MGDPMPMLVAQLVDWVAASRRTYGETMAAWRTSCPRLPVWEEAVGEGLLTLDPAHAGAMADCPVLLTRAGRTMRAQARERHAEGV